MMAPNENSGPNWIHGTEGNIIVDLAKETNSVCFDPPIDKPTWLYDEDGAPVDSHVSGVLISSVWDIIEEAFQYSRTNEISPDQSLLDFVKSRLGDGNHTDQATRQMLGIARLWGDVIGEPIERQSLKFFWLEECIDSGNKQHVFRTRHKT